MIYMLYDSLHSHEYKKTIEDPVPSEKLIKK
jgi:hypothetical protein